MSEFEFTDGLYEVKNGKAKKIQLRPESSKGIVAKYYNWRIGRLERRSEKKSKSLEKYIEDAEAIRQEYPKMPNYGATNIVHERHKLENLAYKIELLEIQFTRYSVFKSRLLKLKENMLNNIGKKSKLAKQKVDEEKNGNKKKNNAASSFDDRENVADKSKNNISPEKAASKSSNDSKADSALNKEDIESAIKEAAMKVQKGGSTKAKVDQFKNDKEDKKDVVPNANDSFNNLGKDVNPSSNVKNDSSKSASASNIDAVSSSSNEVDVSRETPPIVDNLAFSRIPSPYISENGNSKVFDFSLGVEENTVNKDSYMDKGGSMVTISNDGKSKRIEFNYEEKLQEEVDELFNKTIEGLDLDLTDEDVKMMKARLKNTILYNRENKEKAIQAEQAQKVAAEKQNAVKKALFNDLSSKEKESASTNEKLTNQILEFDKKTQKYDQAIKSLTDKAMSVVSNSQVNKANSDLEGMLSDSSDVKNDSSVKGK